MDSQNQQEKKKFLGSLIIPLLLVTLMWVVMIAETSFGANWGRYGIVPHTVQGLLGILTLPFLHGSWEHLLSNSVPVLVLGTALYYCYPTLANRVLLITWLASGLLTWCIGDPASTHIGASALVYGLNLFLIFSGFIRGNRMLIVISLIMVFLYGSFIWGMIPSLAIPQNISWEGHLSGAIIGILLAVMLRKEGPQKEVHHWEEDDEEEETALRQAQGPQQIQGSRQAQGPTLVNKPEGTALRQAQGPQSALGSQQAQGTMQTEGAQQDDSTDSDEKPYWDVPTPSNDELTVRYRFRH